MLLNASMMFVVYVTGGIVRMSKRRSDERREVDTLPLPTFLLPHELRDRDITVSSQDAATCANLARRGVLSTALPLAFYTMPTEGEVKITIAPPDDTFVGMLIMERSGDGHTRPTVQMAHPIGGLTALLEMIKHLCEKFVEECGYLPAEVSLPLLIHLKLILWRYTCIYGMLCDGSEASKQLSGSTGSKRLPGSQGALVKIPFVCHWPSKRNSMIIVRGEG